MLISIVPHATRTILVPQEVGEQVRTELFAAARSSKSHHPAAALAPQVTSPHCRPSRSFPRQKAAILHGEVLAVQSFALPRAHDLFADGLVISSLATRAALKAA